MPTLNWDKRQHAEKTLTQVPYKLLRFEREYTSAKDDATSHTHNLLIQGDNLEALKALLPQYEGRIKCIFIDPPYNTGSAFSHYDDKLAHNVWLAMMYPRLKLLHQLLADDGSIWITIDDNEAHYLKVMLDEIFGRVNFVTNGVWQKKFSPQNDEKLITASHDHILIFAKNKINCRFNRLLRTQKHDSSFANPDNDPRGLWSSGDMTSKTKAAGHSYPVETPSGLVHYPPTGRQWAPALDTYKEWLSDNRVWFGEKGKNKPRIKQFLSEVQDGIVPLSIWTRDEVGDNQDGKREVITFNKFDVFDTPKPERLIERALHIATNPNDFVLDSFLGSGSTAAVAHKMGRRWIGIEMGEHARTHCLPRLEKVIEGEQGGISQSVGWQGGGGFAFYTIGEAVFLPNGHINPKIKFDELAQYVWQSVTRSFSAYTTPKIDEKESPIKTISSQIQNPTEHKDATPLLGLHNDIAYFLLYNGILRDRRPEGGNVLTPALWQWLLTLVPPLQAKKIRYVVYGESCQISKSRRDAMGLEFKQMPYKLSKV